jgi:hypothetical protein
MSTPEQKNWLQNISDKAKEMGENALEFGENAYKSASDHIKLSSRQERTVHSRNLRMQNMRQTLTPREKDIIEKTDTNQQEIIINASEQIKNNFDGLFNITNQRGKVALQTIIYSFQNELGQIAQEMENARIRLTQDSSKTPEQIIEEIQNIVIPSFDERISSLLMMTQQFSDDIRNNGGKNSLEVFLKAESEVQTYLETIKGDEKMLKALEFVMNKNLTPAERAEKKDEVFEIIADKILNEDKEQLKTIAYIIGKMKLLDRAEFVQEQMKPEHQELLIKLIKEEENPYASIIFIDLYGEEALHNIQGLDTAKAEALKIEYDQATNFASLAESYQRESIGARSAALDMMNAENMIGVLGMAWGATTVGLNLLTTWAGGRWREPGTALKETLGNEYILLGAGGAFAGYHLAVGEGFGDMLPDDEKQSRRIEEARREMKNIYISDRSNVHKLINTRGAVFALGNFASTILLEKADNDIDKMKDQKLIMNKEYFSRHLEKFIEEMPDTDTDKNDLIALQNYIENISYDDTTFYKLLMNILVLGLTGDNIEESEKNYEDLLKDL